MTDVRRQIQDLAPEAILAEPAKLSDVRDAEESLGGKVPLRLRELLLAVNGLVGLTGEDLIWPLERIAHDNLQYRADKDFAALYMPFDALLFLAIRAMVTILQFFQTSIETTSLDGTMRLTVESGPLAARSTILSVGSTERLRPEPEGPEPQPGCRHGPHLLDRVVRSTARSSEGVDSLRQAVAEGSKGGPAGPPPPESVTPQK